MGGGVWGAGCWATAGGNDTPMASVCNKVRLIEIDWAVRAAGEPFLIDNRERTLQLPPLDPDKPLC